MSALSEVPAILNIPEKLHPLITELDKYRYFLIEGGRTSAKSQSIARLILYLGAQKLLRTVCGRETQTTIDESVYTIFSDLIRDFKLHHYRVGRTKINHTETGSAINFRGFREQGALNIKGLEGVDILWVEEAQAITKRTLDVIIPTIRKTNSKVIWSMNRHVEHDPVYIAMAGREDCLHIHIDYHENPFCPAVMVKEAEECKAQNIDDYNHIWLGQPLKKGADNLYTTEEVYGSPKLVFMHPGARKRILGVDVARFGDNETVFSIIESYNVTKWVQIYQDTWKNKSTMETVGKIVELTRDWDLDHVVVDDTGVGGGVTDRLGELRIPVTPFVGAGKSSNELYTNLRSDAFFKLKDMLAAKNLKILRDNILQTQLLSIRYKYYSQGGKKAILTKDEMRKLQVKSPDRADALAMAVCYKDESLNPTDKVDTSMPAEYAMTEDGM